MIIDNLTIAGIIAASSFVLMPLMMGREFIRVREGAAGEARPRTTPRPPAARAGRPPIDADYAGPA